MLGWWQWSAEHRPHYCVWRGAEKCWSVWPIQQDLTWFNMKHHQTFNMFFQTRPWNIIKHWKRTWFNMISPNMVEFTRKTNNGRNVWLVVDLPEKSWTSSVGMMTLLLFPTEWKVMKNSMVPVTTNQKVYEFKVDTVHTDLFRVTHAQMFSPFFSPSYWHPGILAPRSSCWTQCHCRWPLSTETTGSYSSTGWKGMASGNLSKSKKPGKKSAKKMQPVG